MSYFEYEKLNFVLRKSRISLNMMALFTWNDVVQVGRFARRKRSVYFYRHGEGEVFHLLGGLSATSLFEPVKDFPSPMPIKGKE